MQILWFFVIELLDWLTEGGQPVCIQPVTMDPIRAKQSIEILSKSQYGQEQYPNCRSCNFLMKVKCVTTCYYKWSIVDWFMERASVVWAGLIAFFILDFIDNASSRSRIDG